MNFKVFKPISFNINIKGLRLLKPDPSRPKLRKLQVLPTCTKSKIEQELPQRVGP
jgi:hypothetical protein